MPRLSRDKKTKKLKETNGLKSREKNQLWRIYKYNNKAKPFRISRSKFSDYLDCKRCFYMDQVLGLKFIDTFPLTLNNTVDELCKKEFDIHRKKQTRHPIMKKYKINAVPFKHKDIEKWQDAKNRGVEYIHPETNLKLTGGIDDVWENRDTKELIVVDYKAQSKIKEKKIKEYLEDPYHESYKRQLDFYRYLFEKNGFKVQKTGYFVVFNATLERETFENSLEFTCDIIPYETKTSYIEKEILNMKNLMDNNKIPELSKYCQECNFIIAGGELIK